MCTMLPELKTPQIASGYQDNHLSTDTVTDYGVTNFDVWHVTAFLI